MIECLRNRTLRGLIRVENGTYLAVVDSSHSSVVTRAERLGAVDALEASDLVEDLRGEEGR